MAEKLAISSKWTPEERELVRSRIMIDHQKLLEEEAEMRKTILWEAPCLIVNLNNQRILMMLAGFLRSADSAFLELNRMGYEGYIVT